MSKKHAHRKRAKLRIQVRTPPGTKPGTVKVDPKALAPKMTVIAYSATEMEQAEITEVRQLRTYLDKWPVTWINVDGLGDEATIKGLGSLFGIHLLALEDVVNVHQRAKVEEYDEHLYIVARMVHTTEPLSTEQISLFLGKNYVLTLQQRPGDCFGPIRQRLKQRKSVMRSESNADYLAYRLLDAVIDSYFPALELYGEQLEQLDDEAANHPSQASFHRVHQVKQNLVLMRRAVWPHRDATNHLIREQSPLVSDDTCIYLRDCYDHSVQIIELLETYREICADVRDCFLSSISNRMNEIMKVLTIIATTFIPLSFVAGVYGMNFNPEVSPWNMPELNWYFGYPFALSLMLLMAAGMLYFFYRRGWLGGSHPSSRRDEEADDD